MARGPEALLDHGIARTAGNAPVAVETAKAPDPARPEIARAFELARNVAQLVRDAVAAGRFPLVLAGNCNSCVGIVAGLQPQRLGAVWFDAHADFDSPEDNRSGFLDVMGLSILTGGSWRALRDSVPGFQVIDEQDVILIGVRTLEPYQRLRLSNSPIQVVQPDRLESIGDEVLARLANRSSSIYLHVDLDVLDPCIGRANEYAAAGGLSVERVIQAIEAIGSTCKVGAAAITAYDPECDPGRGIADGAVKIAEAIRTVATSSIPSRRA
jgi:arginase